MARYQSAETVYAAADEVRTRCLADGQSLLWPKEPRVWSADVARRLWDAISSEQIHGGGFLDRMAVQLASCDTSVHRLAADCLAIYYLFPSNVGSARKLGQITEVIGWKIGGDIPDRLRWQLVFSNGIGSAGPYYINRLWEQFRFIVALAREAAARTFDPADQQSTVDAADRLNASLTGSGPCRNVILHLLYPDSYERIASAHDKRQIAKSFGSLVKDPSGSLDDHLRDIRVGLSADLGRDIDFYDDEDIRHRWQFAADVPISRGPQGGLDLDEYRPTMKIFQGPPGTGKTYQAAREAVAIIDGSIPADPEAFRDRHAQLVEAGRIVWVTFNPNSSYEEFVEGYRPALTETGQVIYSIQPGPFREACERCRRLNPLSTLRVGDRISKGRYEIVAVEPNGVAVRSRTTRKDKVTEVGFTYVDLWTYNLFKEAGVSPAELSAAGSHYEDRRDVAKRSGVRTTFLANSSPQRAVYEHLDALSEGKEQSVVLVIDEINRADLSRVFGELITMLEPDKRESATEERVILLTYSKDRFTVPLRLSVIGTMNTADRSLAVVDVAVRRRFSFVDVEPDPSLCATDYGGVDTAALLRVVNHRIAALMSRDNRFGHSDFMVAKLEERRIEYRWRDDDDGRRRAVASVVRQKMLPLLLEYFHEGWQRADLVLGRCGLLVPFEPASMDSLSEGVTDLTDLLTFKIEEWWDPQGEAWDGDRFGDTIARAIAGQTVP